jgi:mannose-6-phosphate isomerase-like protein (cupin superfamily)
MEYKILNKDSTEVLNNHRNDLYSYTVYKGKHKIKVGERDSCWWIDLEANTVECVSDTTVNSDTLAVVIYGYKPWQRMAEINEWTTLPYVNGCSTTQLLPPIRKGDPTFQLLRIPPHTSEQAHHIHSTARIVYVYSGRGQSVVGQEGAVKTEPLLPGYVMVLDKMVPHHFVTGEEPLVVIPLHIFSSTGLDEHDHPMMNGTHLT